MSTPPEVEITAAACHLPGAPSREAYWERVLAARPAPLTSLASRWGVAGRGPAIVDRACCVEVDVAAGLDRQRALAAPVIERALRQREASGDAPARARTALILATAWAGDAYFDHDARRMLRGLVPDERLPQPASPAVGPGLLLAQLAHDARLEGPRLSVDTACASSLYAVDAGIGLLRAGAADAVVVVGLTGFLPRFLFAGFTKLRALSPSGEILPFARDAGGIVIGEGVGAVLLEREGRAPKALARVIGCGLTCDGAERSVFAPAADGQSRAYAAAYRHVDPGTIDYLEAHGTATPIGDATELHTLNAFFGDSFRERSAALPIGSAKAIVGHLLAAAGMASLLKVLSMLEARTLPPHLQVEPNPQLGETCCELLTRARPWEGGGSPRRAGISSFGFGGSNAHLVLEEAAPSENANKTGAEPTTRGSAAMDLRPLVISDAALTLGSALDEVQWRRSVARSEPVLSTFSAARFGRERDELGGSEASALGAYLPAEFEVETAGLRVGPNLIARMDPLQLLVVSLARRLLARGGLDPSGVATVLTSNLGGQMALRLYRRSLYERIAAEASPAVARFLAPDTTTDTIAGALTPMCSGYAAHHLNLRGLHATFSGEPGALLETLRLAPHWLKEHAHTLFLGAARLLKGPLDLEENVAQGEGAALFVVDLAERAEARGADSLATLLAQGPSGGAACALVGAQVEAIADRETVELSPQTLTGEAQALAGALGEATGVAGLARLLARGDTFPALKLLELCEAGEMRAALLFRQERPWRGAVEPRERPQQVRFVNEPLPRAARGASSTRAPALAAGSAGQLLAEGTAGQLAQSLEHGAAVVHQFLALQRASLSLVGSGSETNPVTPLGRATRTAGGVPSVSVARLKQALATARSADALIVAPREAPEGELHAEVRVDEAQPYFFDHPLDHVPGILLVESALQLAEAAVSELLPVASHEVPALRSVALRFRRWCEKDAPVSVVLVPEISDVGGGSFGVEGRVVQFDEVVATVGLEFRRDPAPRLLAHATPMARAPAVTRDVHKHREENVLVEALRAESEGCWSARLLPAPRGHLLAAGDARVWGGLYLLETARQAVMLAAHGVEGVPFDQPMNLLSFGLSLQRPIGRGASLRWVLRSQPYTQLGNMRLANVQLELWREDEVVGEASVRAQVVDAATYEAQREAGRRADDKGSP